MIAVQIWDIKFSSGYKKWSINHWKNNQLVLGKCISVHSRKKLKSLDLFACNFDNWFWKLNFKIITFKVLGHALSTTI